MIDDAIQELQRGDTGTVRVLANSTPASYILPPVLDRFLKEHARATVQLQSSGGEGADVWRRFLREGYDLVLGLQEPRMPMEFATEWLYDDELLFVVSRCFPLADRINDPEMLAEATVFVGFTEPRWLLRSNSCGTLALRRRDTSKSTARSRSRTWFIAAPESGSCFGRRCAPS